MIDRVSVSQDDEGVWYLGFYADDIRYGVPITEDTIPMLEKAQEQAAQLERAADGAKCVAKTGRYLRHLYKHDVCVRCGTPRR